MSFSMSVKFPLGFLSSQHPWVTPPASFQPLKLRHAGDTGYLMTPWILFLSIILLRVENTSVSYYLNRKVEVDSLLGIFGRMCFSSLIPTMLNSKISAQFLGNLCSLYLHTEEACLTPHYSRKPDPTWDPYFWLGCLQVQFKWHMRTNNRSPVDIPMPPLCKIPNLIV